MRSQRAEFPKSVREEAWKRCFDAAIDDGRCELCGQPLAGRVPTYDHFPIAASLRGPATFENCRVLCPPCNRYVTDEIDKPRIAKAKRSEEKRAGLRKPKYQWPKRKLNTYQRGA